MTDKTTEIVPPANYDPENNSPYFLAYRIRVLEEKVKDHEREAEARELRHAEQLARIEERNAARDKERQDRERSQLIAGISFLGAVLLSALGVIWSFRGPIFRGNIP